ncbi:MAG: carboxylesterase/lipase family protein [Polyangiales bacterium]
MSWHQRRTTLYVVLAYGVLALSTSACDDDLGFGDDDDADYDERNDENATHGGGSSPGGGGTVPPWPGGDWDPDDPNNPDPDYPDPDYPDDGVDENIDDSRRPTVTVETGDLEGRWVDGRIRRFAGIPYAQPPVGDLRFAAPQDADEWDGVRDASNFGPRCAQPGSSTFDNAASDDEDCLYLNVWSPNVRSGQRLPVVFFIHGGEHAYGSASEPLPDGARGTYYDGTQIAERGAVVVTVNYRLGPLGFLSHPALEDQDVKSGDQGLLDQQLALLWVKHNIAAFGGDPKNVTLVGQGSGANDVCLHVVSPTSQLLFHQVVGQSGGCTIYQPEARDVERATAEWVADVGCDYPDADEVVECLREQPVEDLLAKAPAGHPFVPTVDGDFLPDQPRLLFAEGGYRFPYVLGSNTYEGLWYHWDYEKVSSEGAYHAYLQKRFPGVSLEKLCELYPHNEFGETPEAYQRSLARLLSDAYYTCPVTDTALHASEAGADVYLYNFDVVDDSESAGPNHGAELGYVFGTAEGLSNDQRKVSETLQTYWTNLGRYGEPNDFDNDDLVVWPTVYEDGEARLNVTAPDIKVVRDFHAKECAFWRDIYDDQFASNIPD